MKGAGCCFVSAWRHRGQFDLKFAIKLLGRGQTAVGADGEDVGSTGVAGCPSSGGSLAAVDALYLQHPGSSQDVCLHLLPDLLGFPPLQLASLSDRLGNAWGFVGEVGPWLGVPL